MAASMSICRSTLFFCVTDYCCHATMRASLVLRAIITKRTQGPEKASRRVSRNAILPLAQDLAKNDERTGAAASRADIVSPALCGTIHVALGKSSR